MTVTTSDISYLTPQDARALSEQRAIPLPAVSDDTELGAVLVKASDWLDSCFDFRGDRAAAHQSRAWPRLIDGLVTQPPAEVRLAVLEIAAALSVSDGEAEILLGLRPGISRERIGDISVSYHSAGSGRQNRISRSLARFLRPSSYRTLLRQ